MAEIIDTRGLACPQPVLLTLSKMKEMQAGEIEVMVDTGESRDNITRAARSQGWNIRAEAAESGDFRLVLERA
jgi:tRNA 2-thiouridine synthesizing protein A